MFESDELGPSSMDFDEFNDTFYSPADDSSPYDLPLEGQSDELSSLEQSYPSSSIPNSPGSSESLANEGSSPRLAISSYVESQPVVQEPAESAVIKLEKCEPVVRPAPKVTRQPAAKRGRSANVQSQALIESKIPDMLNAENLDNYMQSLAKGKSEDIELFRNVLRCQGNLTPETEKQLKHLARQVKNRESAQLSRQRKREYVQTLKSVIDKMRGVDSTLRAELSTSQVEAAQYKAETERWQSYAQNLQRILAEHGIDVPEVPEASTKNVTVPCHPIPPFMFPETLFDGPCGFGHMTPSKKCNGKRRARSEKAKHTKEVSA